MKAQFLFLCLLILFQSCKKNNTPDPDQNVQSYITFTANGEKYKIENGADHQYIQYQLGEETGTLPGYIFTVGRADSVGVIPSFGAAIRSKKPVTVGKWVHPTSWERAFETNLGAILPQYEGHPAYAG